MIVHNTVHVLLQLVYMITRPIALQNVSGYQTNSHFVTNTSYRWDRAEAPLIVEGATLCVIGVHPVLTISWK